MIINQQDRIAALKSLAETLKTLKSFEDPSPVHSRLIDQVNNETNVLALQSKRQADYEQMESEMAKDPN